MPFLAAPMDSRHVADHRDRARPPRRPRRARPRGPLDPLRRPGAAARGDRRARPGRAATARMQEIYAEPIKPELITARIAGDPRRRRHGRRRAHPAAHPGVLQDRRRRRRRPLRHPRHDGVAPSTSRTTPSRSTSSSSSTSSTSRSSSAARATYTAALHLMRTGAAGVLVGFGGGAAHTTRADPRHPRADGDGRRRRRRRAARLPRRVRRPLRARHRRRRPRQLAATSSRPSPAAPTRSCSARRSPAPTEAPGGGWHWGPEAHHYAAAARRPGRGRHSWRRSRRSCSGRRRVADGTTNLVGALRRSMATTGYSDLKEFQRVEVVVAPYSGS